LVDLRGLIAIKYRMGRCREKHGSRWTQGERVVPTLPAAVQVAMECVGPLGPARSVV